MRVAVIVHDLQEVEIEHLDVGDVGLHRRLSADPIGGKVVPEADRRAVRTAAFDDAEDAFDSVHGCLR